MAHAIGGSRRTTELLLLCTGAIPVLLLYSMYLMNTGAELNLTTLAVPIGLIVAFIAAHIGVRVFAPGADPAILPIVFVLSGIGITFVTRLAPEDATGQVVWLFVSVATMVGVLALVPNLDRLAQYKYTIGIAGVALLLLPALVGTEIYGSKLWIRVGSFSFSARRDRQGAHRRLPLAAYLSENRELLSASSHKAVPSRCRACACSRPCSSCGACACSSSSSRGIWAARRSSSPCSWSCSTSPQAASATCS